MAKFGIGQPVPRTEDPRLVTGHGRYTDDIRLDGEAHSFFVRSPHAHARIRHIDVSAARAQPGVVAIYTGETVQKAGLGLLECGASLTNRDGSAMKKTDRPVLALDRVRHVGDAVAMIVAETMAQARDAADHLDVDYEELPSVTGTADATQKGAAQIWDMAPNNIAFDWEDGDEAKTAAAFKRADRVVSVDMINNRVVPNSMEPRGAIGDYDGKRMTLYTSSQGSHGLRSRLAAKIFKVPEESIRVITPDVGGGFGMKIFLYAEQAMVLYAARELKRPVRWEADRGESFLSDTHGRDHVTTAQAALDKDGRFLAFRFDITANLGAYLSQFGPGVPTSAGAWMYAGVYRLEACYLHVTGVYTNTNPVDAYRGAGRPEANYAVERLVDAAARELGLSPDEIRQRNFIPKSAMPYTTVMGATYDSGDFAKNMTDAMKLADWSGFAARRSQSAKAGKRRGIGLATYIEACGGGGQEGAWIKFAPDGRVTILSGTQSNGQGHETAYIQILSDRLGIEPDMITVKQGDTDQVPTGTGTGGSRSVPVGGGARVQAAEKVIEKGKRIAGHSLEADTADIEFDDGRYRIVGTDRAITFSEVVSLSFKEAQLPEEARGGLDDMAYWAPENGASTFPNGCHICEVEVDPDTGVTTLVNFTVVDDFGTVINPLLLAGQIHGGIGQGIGQAMTEHTVYDAESGQLLSASFMDYGLPRADHMPPMAIAFNNEPCTTNILGMKGAGEAGAIGAPPAVINAIVDALEPLGIRHVDMPATAQQVWRRLQAAPRQAA
ncbi:MAG: xanthine dehydrogenase family protein molybdopterin-binding subunit [Alphaproteobacteria bacterium]